jgi:hypothetical protein
MNYLRGFKCCVLGSGIAIAGPLGAIRIRPGSYCGLYQVDDHAGDSANTAMRQLPITDENK